MKFSIETLLKDDSPKKFLFFWGHQPAKDGSITKSCFSQWWESPFIVDGIAYKTAEHWMMAKKAVLFGDAETEAKILACTSAAEAKKLGREVRGYDDGIWTAQRYAIVAEGNCHKFNQNKDLGEFLLATGDVVLTEASPVDPIWGIGCAEDHPDAQYPEKWRGLNLLGFALMEVREKIKENNII